MSKPKVCLHQGDLFAPPPALPAPRTTSHRDVSAPSVPLTTLVPKRTRTKQPQRTIQERFDAYCAAHPEVWAMYLKFSYELLKAGRRRYGVAAITERIRWEYAIRGDDTEQFKLSNDYRSRFARKLIDHDAAFADLFTTRPLRSA